VVGHDSPRIGAWVESAGMRKRYNSAMVLRKSRMGIPEVLDATPDELSLKGQA